MNLEVATLYVVVESRLGSGDWTGVLVSPKDGVLWGHLSSGPDFLRRDLTDGFTSRRKILATRYPDGYDVVFVGIDDELPAAIAHWSDSASSLSAVPGTEPVTENENVVPRGD